MIFDGGRSGDIFWDPRINLRLKTCIVRSARIPREIWSSWSLDRRGWEWGQPTDNVKPKSLKESCDEREPKGMTSKFMKF